MANGRYINIDFPFKDSPQGFFLNLNADRQRAIKADLMHLLLTRRGQRLYNPNFGTDLLRFIFEQNDNLSWEKVKEEVSSVVKKYLPSLIIDELDVTQSVDTSYGATISLKYTVTDEVFSFTDTLTINV